ncbi:hypothetical protein AB0K60_07325 [Thermopolyspora sp. NPDC052614]|uniref:hypothetical protein n=1 Tax=Thermopolyspora sp. NPDC052614 TaxID=3155682 RepID=UPI0034139E3E
MRAARFERYLRDLLAGSGNLAIKDVMTFGEVGYDSLPNGLQVSFLTGARIYLQVVRTSPPGGDSLDNPEIIKSGEALALVPEPAFGVENNRVNVKKFEVWLTARINNSGNSEIQGVRNFQGKAHRYGIDVVFYNGAHAYVYFPYTLSSGQEAGAHPIYEAKEII